MEFRSFDHTAELAKQRALFEECFPENIGTPVLSNEHYLWKFHQQNGSLLTSQEYAASQDGNLLGYYAAIPYTYRYKNKVLNAAMVCDVMTGVKARGKGVFTRLGIHSTDEMKSNNFDFTTGYPIREEVIPGHMKAGWEKRFELPLYGRFIQFNSFLRKKKLGIFSAPAKLVFNLYCLFKKTGKAKNKDSLNVNSYNSTETNIGELLNGFYNAWSEEIPISLEKSETFVNWRLSAPEKEYKVLTLCKEGEIVGALIAREVVKEDVPCYGILDLCLLEGFHEFAYLLIDELISHAKQADIELLLTMISPIWLDKYQLNKSAFLKTPFTFHFITKHFNDQLSTNEIYQAENWHLMWIDSDDL